MTPNGIAIVFSRIYQCGLLPLNDASSLLPPDKEMKRSSNKKYYPKRKDYAEDNISIKFEI